MLLFDGASAAAAPASAPPGYRLQGAILVHNYLQVQRRLNRDQGRTIFAGVGAHIRDGSTKSNPKASVGGETISVAEQIIGC